MSHTPLFPFAPQRRFDIACLGRLAVDLYAQQIGAPLEEVSSFRKYLGGSSANIAYGAARLGLSSAMISRVGDEQMGQFLIDELQRQGCNTEMVQRDPERLTGLVLLGLKDSATFPLLFYRENCADMALTAEGISEEFIASCRSLLITGTHLSTDTVRAASQRALDLAARHQVFRVLDIDYRPVLWGLTGRGQGENRFVANDQVSARLQQMLPHFDLLIGTEEEFLIAGGVSDDLLASLRAVRAITTAAMVVKLGAAGCCFIAAEVPADLAQAPQAKGFQVKVLNVLGAGDAFAAGLMSGFLRGKNFHESARIANACGALVVSRHACAPAMPTPIEIDHWLAQQEHSIDGVDSRLSAALQHLHRTTVARPQWPELYVLAFDHRRQFLDMAQSLDADPTRLPKLKKLLLRAALQTEKKLNLTGRIGVLIDGDIGADALHEATGRKWWVGRPVELPSSRPLRFDGTRSIGSWLTTWPIQQTVKCLVFYHPDDDATLRLEQEQKIAELYEATRISGHELLLEFIPPAGLFPQVSMDTAIYRTMLRFYNLGVQPEWWKLPPLAPDCWQQLSQLIQARDPYCRGMVILGLNQPLSELAATFQNADASLLKGFMVGRSIWGEASLAWLAQRSDDAQLVATVQKNFEFLIDAWQQRRRAHLN